MDNSQFDFPDILDNAIEPFARGFGLNRSAATLLLLQMVGAVAGPSVRTRTPELMDLTPAFNLAFIHDGRAMIPGAALAAFQGARLEIEEAIGAQETDDRRALVEKLRRMQTQNADLIAEIKAKEDVAAGRHPPVYARSPMEQVLGEFHQFGDELKSRRELPDLREKRTDIQRHLIEVIMAVHRGVIRKCNDWPGLIDAGRHSLDGHFLQISEACSLLAETNSKANRLKACTELLQRSRSDSPISGFDFSDNGYRATLHLSGSPEEFTALLQHPRMKSLGFVNSFLFCESDAEQPPDADALADFGNSKWHEFVAQLFRLRVTGYRTQLMFDRDGCQSWLAFREWCREFNFQLPWEKRVYFLRWPEMLARMATSLAVIADDAADEILKGQYLESAAVFLKDCAVQQAAILGRPLDRKPDITRLGDAVAKLVRRLEAKGPQTHRQLARGFHGQHAVIAGPLFEAVRRRLVILREDGRYYAASGNGIAATEPDGTEYREEVRA